MARDGAGVTDAAQPPNNAARQARWREKQAEALAEALRERDEARTAARTIAAEALEKISYSYRADIERGWIKRWHWLPEGEALRLARLRWPEFFTDEKER